MFRTLYTLCLLSLTSFLFAQMPSATGDVLYGHEWIDYDRAYLKVSVIEDGVFRISSQQIAAAGMVLNETNADKWTLHHQGQAVPIEVTDDGIVFYGEKNRGELDQHLFESPEEMQLNERYSMYCDTANYYLSLAPVGGPFYQSGEPTGELTPLNEILRTSEVVFGDYQTKAYRRSSGVSIYYSHYEPAEGFGSRSGSDLLSSNGMTESAATLPSPQANGGQASLDIRFGLGFGDHRQEIKTDNNLVTTINASAWTVQQSSLTITPNGDEVAVSLSGTATDQDKANLAWMELIYPANPVFDEQLSSFSLPARSTGSRLQLSGVGADAGAMQVYAPASSAYINGTVTGGTATFRLPASNEELRYQLVVNNNYLSPAATAPHRFTSSLPTDEQTNYLILTSSRLNGAEIQQMADYRRSAAGGNYRVHIVNAEDLFDEFGYGIQNHPMAIRNYLSAARQLAPQLQYLFLIGKGREYPDIRRSDQLANEQETFFLPSFGFPASDNLLSADLGSVVPNLSTGRLAAISREEIGIYLEKLMEVESQISRGDQSIEDRDWMKQIMHLGGGGTAGEQFSIRRNLLSLEETVENSTMGAKVTSFYKTSTDPIEDSRQEAIFDRINEGTAIITFYGHSSSQGFDFSIDEPANYFNKGKYPYMLSLGCYSGDAFTKARSISERFIFLRDKGAVAFAASKGVGFIGALSGWANQLYDQTGNAEYGNGIGDAMRKSIDHFQNTTSFSLAILLEQFSLSGDPAYRLHPRPGPDLVVDPSSIQFTPAVVPAQNTTYQVNLRLLNLGSGSTSDSITLRFDQELPNGEITEIYRYRTAAPAYEEFIELDLPNQGLPSVGINRIFVSVDADEELSESPQPSAELNNNLVNNGQLGVPLTFIANTAKVAFPPEYGVIGGTIELAASTTNALSESREYIIEVSEFNDFSSLADVTRITSPGGILRYSPAFTPTDSTTYYWRISPDSIYTQGAGYIWSESSFTWLASQPDDQLSWAMQAPGQIIDGKFTNINGNDRIEAWNFTRTINDVKITNAIYQSSTLPRMEINQGRRPGAFNFRRPTGIAMIVVDSINNSDWLDNPGGLYGTANRRTETWTWNTRTQAQREQMITFLREAVEPGKYVLLYSLQRNNNREYYNEGWLQDSAQLGTSIFDVLEEEGATQIRELTNLGAVPYVFIYQKGIGPLTEVIANNQEDVIIANAQTLENWSEGTWSTPQIGPSSEWRNASFDILPRNVQPGDSIRLLVTGYAPSGEVSPLLNADYRIQENRRYNLNLSSIDADSYPHISIEISFYDDLFRTSPTLGHLYINYTGTGDVAINPVLAFSSPDSLQQGEEINLSVAYENLGYVEMDSLLVELRINDEANNETLFSTRQAPLPGKGNDEVTFTLPSEDFNSNLRYSLVLNPNQDQAEEVLFNNNLVNDIKIGQDVIDPTLQVFFDGRTIANGELVSAEPEILIQLKDENRYLLLNDTAAYTLNLKAPSGAEERISFSDQRVEFIPASTEANQAEIYLRNQFVEDGIYTLTIRSSDRTSNLSGRLDFQKDFEIITESRVSNVLTYPNPFTTQTQFVYTLTGSEVPDVFRIQIMTVSGRVVRDIDLLEIEEVKLGTHRTDFYWDGTDEYGDLLANGVYLYRVITSDSSGTDFKKHDTGTSQYFQNDLGKVVILR